MLRINTSDEISILRRFFFFVRLLLPSVLLVLACEWFANSSPAYSQTAPVQLPWHLDRIDQREAPLDKAFITPGTGYGVTIYVLDTGVRMTHDAFGGRAAVADVGRKGDLVGDDYGMLKGGDDCNGHGTHMAALAAGYGYGVAPAAAIRAVRVADCFGNGAVEPVNRALEWLIVHGERPAVVLMSLILGESPLLSETAQRAVESGLTLVVSAGASMGDACDFSPSGANGVITVAPSDMDDTPLVFSNLGPCVDLFAPGKSILSADTQSDTAARIRNGSSPAAALVAGAAALILEQYPTATPCDVKYLLTRAATENAVALTKRGHDTNTPRRLLYAGVVE